MNTVTHDAIDLFRVLKLFTTVYELGSFSAAARLHSITPGAVSKQIGAFEDSLGCRLFQRSTRSLCATEEGRRLYSLIQQPAQQIEEALASLSSEEGQPRGTVKVSLPIAFSRTAILPSLARFRERFADIVLDLHFENRHVDLISEGYDCAIGQRRDTDSNIIARPLAPLLLILCASPTYLDRHGKNLTLETLGQHQLIAFRSPTSGRIEAWKLEGDGNEFVLQPPARLMVTDTEAQAELAVAGCGITLLGAHHALPFIEQGKLQRVLAPHFAKRGDICIYYPARKNLPRRVSTFVEFVIDEARGSAVVRRIKSIGKRSAAAVA